MCQRLLTGSNSTVSRPWDKGEGGGGEGPSVWSKNKGGRGAWVKTSSSYFNLTFLDTRNSMALATWKAALTRSVTENCLSGSSEGVNHVGSYQPLLFLRNCSMFPYGQYSMITHKSQWRPMSQMRTQLGYWINNPTYPLILSPLVVVWTGEDLDTDRSDRTHRTAANFSTHTWYRSIHPNQLRYKSHTWETQLVAMSLTFLKQWCMLFKLPSCTHETGKVNKDQFLPTYPSPTPTLSLTFHLRQNVGLGRGRWSVS